MQSRHCIFVTRSTIFHKETQGLPIHGLFRGHAHTWGIVIATCWTLRQPRLHLHPRTPHLEILVRFLLTDHVIAIDSPAPFPLCVLAGARLMHDDCVLPLSSTIYIRSVQPHSGSPCCVVASAGTQPVWTSPINIPVDCRGQWTHFQTRSLGAILGSPFRRRECDRRHPATNGQIRHLFMPLSTYTCSTPT
jgi:hypothetical protein